MRPIAQRQSDIVSPADGCISQIGDIERDTILQAKNFHFSVESLLGGSSEDAQLFQNGQFATIYLAPRDYHRVHMPLTGKLLKSTYIPGQLFSVNQFTANAVPNLFARNERLVSLFETASGPMAVILVGAMMVSSIKTIWPSAHPRNKITTEVYPDNITLERGNELGYFEMGSTVIVLFAHDKMRWNDSLQETSAVKMGQAIGQALA